MARAGGARGAQSDLLVVGHTNIDRFVEVDRLPDPDRTVPVLGARELLGGTAANIALAAAGAGLSSRLWSLVGPEFPPAFSRRLRSAGVDVRGLLPIPGARSPSCLIVEDRRGRQVTLIDQGAMGGAGAAPLPERLLEGVRWVHLTTGDPVYQLRVAAAARRRGLPVGVDPAQEVHYRWTRPQLERLLGSAEILFGNRAEIAAVRALLGVRRTSHLLERVPLVVETWGHLGARAYSRRGEERVPAENARRGARAVGAGDAFRGGFYASWLSGEPLGDCLLTGARTARRWIADRLPSGGDP